MKTKFETNVATELPKTKSQEPELPWKVKEEDLEEIGPATDEYKSAVTGVPPLKTRAIFLVMLLIAVFATILYYLSTITIDNERVRESIQKKEAMLASIQSNIEKINSEKNALSESLSQLDKRIRDLSAQKELFTAVIESLTKKGDEVQVEKEEAEKLPENAENPAGI